MFCVKFLAWFDLRVVWVWPSPPGPDCRASEVATSEADPAVDSAVTFSGASCQGA